MSASGLYDTHAHFPGDPDGIAAILKRARAAGVERLMAVGGSPELNGAALKAAEIAAADPDAAPRVVVALGTDRDQPGLLPVEGTRAAVGEIGLDFHYSPETAPAQEKLFAAQLEEAKRLGLPVVIHTRDADDATLGVLDETDSHFGVIHCFTGSVPFEKKLLDRGFHVSISGIVTFRAAENVRDAARYAPDDRLLVETDSPFLAPVPMRGQANEPAFLVHTAAFLADLRGTTPEALALLTTANAVELLGA